MEASIELNDVNSTTLEKRVVALEEQNFQIGREINMMRENIAQLETPSTRRRADSTPTSNVDDEMIVGVHLASYRNMETTTAGWHTYIEKYGDDFDDLKGVVSVFTSADGESFFRLKAGPFATKDEARNFCAILEAQEDYCNLDTFEGAAID